MRGPVLVLVTTFATSIVAAPILSSSNSPIEGVQLLARSVNKPVGAPILSLAKRTLLGNLENIIKTKRAVPSEGEEEDHVSAIEPAESTEDLQSEQAESGSLGPNHEKPDLAADLPHARRAKRDTESDHPKAARDERDPQSVRDGNSANGINGAQQERDAQHIENVTDAELEREAGEEVTTVDAHEEEEAVHHNFHDKRQAGDLGLTSDIPNTTQEKRDEQPPHHVPTDVNDKRDVGGSDFLGNPSGKGGVARTPQLVHDNIESHKTRSFRIPSKVSHKRDIGSPDVLSIANEKREARTYRADGRMD